MRKLSFLLLLLNNVVLAQPFHSNQPFLPKSFYLLDSLVEQELHKSDKVMLDSALSLYHKAKTDSVRLRYLNILAGKLGDRDFRKNYNDIMFELTEKNLSEDPKNKIFLRYKIICYSNAGYFHSHKGEILKAIEYYYDELRLSLVINELDGVASSFTNIGSFIQQEK